MAMPTYFILFQFFHWMLSLVSFLAWRVVGTHFLMTFQNPEMKTTT